MNYGTWNETFPSEYTIFQTGKISTQQQLPLASAKAEDDKKANWKLKEEIP